MDYVPLPGQPTQADPPRPDDVGFHAEPQEPEEKESRTKREPDDRVEPDYSEPVDPIDALLEDIEEDSDSSGYIIQVFRLPNYARDGKLAGTQREYCGDVPAGLDYLAQIRDGYDGGRGATYHCTLKDSARRIVRKWAVTLARTQEQAQPQPATALLPVQPPSDPIAEVLRVAERYKQLREAFFPGEALQLATSPQAEPPTTERSFEDRIFDKLLDRADGDALDRFVDRYVGGGKSDSWMGIIADGLKPFIPTIIQLVARAQAGNAVGTNAAGQPIITQPIIDGMVDAAIGEGEDDFMQIIDEILLPLLEECVTARQVADATIERGASSVRQFAQRGPLNRGYVEMLKHSPIEVVINLLVAGYPELKERAERDPIIREAIAALQRKLLDGDAESTQAQV